MAETQANVVTRFAPSPTGFLHIGGARTALYNWLYAKHTGGKFLLRIEDTDKARSTQEAIDAILDGMAWLGLDFDGEAISQAGRASRHKEVAETLLANGKAYKCFATQDELQEAREEARANGTNFLGDIWRDKDPATAPDGATYTIRLKMPRGGSFIINDKVQGTVEVSHSTLDDMILLRSDGSPTYMLAVVVDDYDMGVTNVIRGDDHLNNTFRQIAVYDAMDWPLPVYAHIPLIHGADGKKLSKRHGALGVDAYRDMGYLPEALRNYLLRLGWSHGDEEIIPTDKAIEWFGLDAIGASPSRFDFDKLDYVNSHYQRNMEPAALFALLLPWLEKLAGRTISDVEITRVTKALPSLTERAKRLDDLSEMAILFCNIRPLTLSDKAEKAVGEGKDYLSATVQALTSLPVWEANTTKESLMATATALGIKAGPLMQAVRAALTGGRPSGDLAEIMEILGREETLARLNDWV